MLLRPTHPSRVVPEPATEVADELSDVLGRFGAESGHYSILGPDPWRIIWNHDRTGFVSFLEARHCLLSWRSPVADPTTQRELVALLLAYAHDVKKHLIAVPVNDATRRAGEALGMRSTWIGTECLIDLPHWSLDGGRRQKVRWARSHAATLGFKWREALPLIDRQDFSGLQRVEELWKEERAERRTDSFLRNSFTELAHLRRYFVCEGPDGIVASTTCTPVNRREWYLQDPVRDPRAPRGALEGTMALALDTLRDEGFSFASNGTLPFWRPDGTLDISFPLGVVGRRVLHHFDQRYRFQHINQFRSKFVPDATFPVFVLRSHRVVTPGVARSLTTLLTRSTS